MRGQGQVGVEKAQEIELSHAANREGRSLLRHHAHNFIPQAWAGEPADEIGRSCCPEQGQRVFLDVEAEPLLKADGAKHTGRVVHEAALMEDADDFAFEIALASIEIHELPKWLAFKRMASALMVKSGGRDRP